MKQSLKQSQKLSLKLTANLGNQIKLLSLSGFEISSKLNELIEEYCDENDKKISIFKEEFLSDKYRNAIYKKEVEYKLPEKLLLKLIKRVAVVAITFLNKKIIIGTMGT